MTFDELFIKATGIQQGPFPYQRGFCTGEHLPSLVRVPTGLGKTAMAILGWLWRRRFADQAIQRNTPRRLVYCLPMRVLVEQTYREAIRWLRALDLLAGNLEGDAAGRPLPNNYVPPTLTTNDNRIAVHLLMGGEQMDGWDLRPECDAVFIGTQDMLLSRALNRGYGSARSKWPVEFALLNNDCLWVFDEVQLMGNGVATSSQLDAFRRALWKSSNPCLSLWMSATLGDDIVRTRDRDDLGIAVGRALSLSAQDRNHPSVCERLNAQKNVAVLNGEPSPKQRDGNGILDRHSAGRLSLVIVNTVPVAQRLYQVIRKASAIAKKSTKRKRPTKKTPAKGSPQADVLLLHGRFRPVDRRSRMDGIDQFCDRQGGSNGATPNHPGLIVVSTQVVEAGYDISAVRLWSEIAPWSSVVQRLGRLNREGKQPDARGCFWMPRADTKGENAPDRPNAKRIGPYERTDLQTSKNLLEVLAGRLEAGKEVHPALDAVLELEESRSALKLTPEAVIRPDDFYGLVSTEPDLAGGFTDISPFVRSIDRDVDVLVFWREFDVKRGPIADEPSARRDELCPVPFYVFRQFLSKGWCWEWDFENDTWQRRRAVDIFPGMTLMLASSQGGYSGELGWTGDPNDKPNIIEFDDTMAHRDRWRIVRDSMMRDPGSEAVDWHTIADHLDDVVTEVEKMLRDLPEIDAAFTTALRTAAAWHDWGKSLPRWQKAVVRYAKRTIERIDGVLSDVNASRLHGVAKDMKDRFRRGLSEADGTLWAKFPDTRQIIADMPLTNVERDELFSRIRAAFRPNLRHEAASALAAWKAWRSGNPSLNALAVYLIGSHHGKVRTVLRSLGDFDEVFGLTADDKLHPVFPRFTESIPLSFEPKLLGSTGYWNDEGTSFTLGGPSWIAMVGELLGPPPGYTKCSVALNDTEPAKIGVFMLALLEAILRAADVRASRNPGKGAQS